jgi:hypothetical protein
MFLTRLGKDSVLLAWLEGCLPLWSEKGLRAASEDAFACRRCRGHGTQVVEDSLVATVSGVVEKVNRLVTVRTLHSRYSAEVGDVVVGRVVEVRS